MNITLVSLLSIFAFLVISVLIILLYKLFMSSDLSSIGALDGGGGLKNRRKNSIALKAEAERIAIKVAEYVAKTNGEEYIPPSKEEIKKYLIELKNEKIARNLTKLLNFSADQGNNIVINKIDFMIGKHFTKENEIEYATNTVDTLSRIDNEISDDLNAMSTRIYEVKISPVVIGSRTIKKIKKEIATHNARCEELQKNFTEIAKSFFATEEYIVSEYVFYKSNFQILKQTVITNKNKLDAVYELIASRIDSIESRGKILSSTLDGGDIKLANKYLNLYSTQVSEFSNTVEKALSLSTYIFFTIPNLTDEVVKLYRDFDSIAKNQLHFLNFQKRLEEIATNVVATRKQYLKLELENAEEEIKKCFSLVHNLKRKLIYEKEAFRIIHESDSKLQKSITDSFDRLNLMIRKYTELFLNKRKSYSIIELELLAEQLSAEKEEILFVLIEYNNRLKDTSSPFSGKMLQLKILCNQLQNLNKKMNEFELLIFRTKAEENKAKFQINSIENLLSQLIISATEKNIPIPDAQSTLIRKLQNVILEISSEITIEGVSQNTKKRILQLIAGAIDIYRTVSSEINTATIVRNLISYFSPMRANRSDLHATLIEVERNYMDAHYHLALNNVIMYLELRKENNV